MNQICFTLNNQSKATYTETIMPQTKEKPDKEQALGVHKPLSVYCSVHEDFTSNDF